MHTIPDMVNYFPELHLLQSIANKQHEECSRMNLLSEKMEQTLEIKRKKKGKGVFLSCAPTYITRLG
jgi:hypothetical protein